MSQTEPQLHPDYVIRPVEKEDYQGVISSLSVLTKVGDVSEEKFIQTVQYMKSHPDIYNTVVIVNNAKQGKVVGVGSIIVEQKFIHGCGKVGHIEDIAVSSEEQGKKLGYHLIKHLSKIGQEKGCYKVILDCAEKNIKFYEKCGYKKEGFEMAARFWFETAFEVGSYSFLFLLFWGTL